MVGVLAHLSCALSLGEALGSGCEQGGDLAVKGEPEVDDDGDRSICGASVWRCRVGYNGNFMPDVNVLGVPHDRRSLSLSEAALHSEVTRRNLSPDHAL